MNLKNLYYKSTFHQRGSIFNTVGTEVWKSDSLPQVMPWPFGINELVTFSFPIFSDVIFSHYVKSEENDKRHL